MRKSRFRLSARYGLALLLMLGLSSCEPGCTQTSVTLESASDQKVTRSGPEVDANYAYDSILKYEKFGPKVPGNLAHSKAGDWIVEELKSSGLLVHEQKGTAKTFDGKTIPIRNIVGQINPSATTRYLLSAHWDNRPFADQDQGKNKRLPVPGVNDGGSGVVVLLAIAKAAVAAKPAFGIDFAFWDAEDWGNPQGPENTYCLGSQLWAKNTVPPNYSANFGINFDMVGRIGSLFPIERYSMTKAPQVIKGLREAAAILGYQDFFPDYEIGPIVDDHYFVTEGTGIPMVDLIYMDPDGRFSPEWHTVDDNSKHISRDVLKVVAQTTIQLLWSQK